MRSLPALRRLMRRWPTSRPISPIGDIVIAAAFLVLATTAMAIARDAGWLPLDGASYVVIALITSVVIPASRLFPRATLVLVAIIVIWPSWDFDVPELRLLPLMVTAYRAAALGATLGLVLPVSAIVTFFALTPWFLNSILNGWPVGLAATDYPDPSRRILTAVIVLAAILLGIAARNQTRVAEDLRQRNAELVRLRDVDRARVAAEERTTIAREIHDVVAHHVSAMVIRAQAADRVADSKPGELRAAVRWIAADGRDALGAMRQIVRVLRDDAVQPSAAASVSLGDALAAVAARVQATGIKVEVHLAADTLAEFEQLTVLRIAQEALTNVMLHSSAGKVTIDLTVDNGHARLVVLDDGKPRERFDSTGTAGGSGIRGMTERAMALGGTLTAGAADGGWRVVADLPLVAASAAAAAGAVAVGAAN